MIDFKRDSDNLIVAGNGPSLKNIDLNSMPKEYDVFRCNQFYCEDKYYLGKNIKLVMFNPSVIYSQLETLYQLEKNNEYRVEYVCLGIPNKLKINFDLNTLFKRHPYLIILDEILQKDKILFRYLSNIEEWEKMNVTSGIYLIALGIIFGYKNIYYTGIDFYETNQINNAYCYNIPMDGGMHKLIYNKNMVVEKCHSKNIDMETMNFFTKYYNHQITLQKAPNLNSAHNKLAIQKQNNYINDIIVSKYDFTNKKINIFKKIRNKLKKTLSKKYCNNGGKLR
ncbi:alpha-2,3-sialyltransferase [Campylobacter sp. MG1]|uniref:alpha-2,3-sialyltransferase n=1 Tax=Campylobacter sp. MG1 TaxID=2976332 RepID=UPI00226CDF1F|nr:alpha-2,3-sialyltransferase [Campylobacter sp. MG1]